MGPVQMSKTKKELSFAEMASLSIVLRPRLVRLFLSFLIPCPYTLGNTKTLNLSAFGFWHFQFIRAREFLILICGVKIRVHTEVVISDQPRWISSHGNALDSNPSQSHVGNSKFFFFLMTFSQQ